MAPSGMNECCPDIVNCQIAEQFRWIFVNLLLSGTRQEKWNSWTLLGLDVTCLKVDFTWLLECIIYRYTYWFRLKIRESGGESSRLSSITRYQVNTTHQVYRLAAILTGEHVSSPLLFHRPSLAFPSTLLGCCRSCLPACDPEIPSNVEWRQTTVNARGESDRTKIW